MDVAGGRQGHSLSLVDVEAEVGGAAVENLAQALRLGADHRAQLRAAGGGRGGGVSGDVVEAW